MLRLLVRKKPETIWGRELVESSQELAAVTTLKGRFVWTNEALCRTAGLGAEQLIGRMISDLAQISSKALVREQLRKLAVSDSAPVIRFDFSVGQSGSEVFEAVVQRNIGEGQDEPVLFWQIRNVTEQRMEAAKLQRELREKERLLETMPLEMWMTDLNSNLIHANKRAAKLFGIPPGDAHLEMYEIELGVILGDESLGTDIMRDVVANISGACGTDSWFILDKLPYSNAEGIQIGWVYFARDISESRQAENLLRKTQAKLSSANKQLHNAAQAKDHFLASVSHELRTPLNSVLGLSEILLGGIYGTIEGEQKEAVRTIRKSGKHLLELINNILDLSKMEAAKLEIESNVIELAPILKMVRKLIEPLAAQHKVRFELSCDPTIETILADEVRLRQILLNLLSNAIKFTKPGTSIGLRIRPDYKSDQLHLIVWDSGKGISEKEVETLFRPFEQLDNARQAKHAGTGIGLPLTKGLVELHQGSIEVKGRTDGKSGTEFCVILPWPAKAQTGVPEVETQLTKTVLIPESTSRDISEDEKGNILLAEDNPTNQKIVSTYLTRCGFSVRVANNGNEAVDRAKEHIPDLILMDVHMPEKDGIQAMQELRAFRHTRHIPIVALTGMAGSSDKELCLRAGADHFVSKPVDLADLVILIEGCLSTGLPA